MKEVKETVKVAGCRKENCFIWEEFLDYFFLKDLKDEDKVKVENHWWRKIDAPLEEEKKEAEKENEPEQRKGPRYGGINYQIPKEEIKVTPAMDML